MHLAEGGSPDRGSHTSHEASDLSATTSSKPVVLFDLDGVLSRHDTMTTLLLGRLRRRPWRFLVTVPVGLLSLLFPSTGRRKPRLHRRLMTLTLQGLSEADYIRLAATTGQRLAADPNNVPSQAVSAVFDATSAGQALVVTASEYHLASSFLIGIGLGEVELLASNISFTDGKVRIVEHNVGAAKVHRVRSAGVDISTATLYTDSSSDLPLALEAARTILVNPTKSSLRVMTEQVTTIKTVDWG